jgi:DNA-binding NtrC family response regulator
MTSPKCEQEKRMNILAIDDEITIRKLYVSILEEEGHHVSVAANAQEAVAQVNQKKFDLVFLDLKLPDIDGTEILKMIRDKLEWAPVVIVTANPSIESSIEAIRTGGVYEYIIKPFTPKELNLSIRRAIEKAELSLENKRLIRRLEAANKALTERVQEFEECANYAYEYEKRIEELQKRIKQLESR